MARLRQYNAVIGVREILIHIGFASTATPSSFDELIEGISFTDLQVMMDRITAHALVIAVRQVRALLNIIHVIVLHSGISFLLIALQNSNVGRTSTFLFIAFDHLHL